MRLTSFRSNVTLNSSSFEQPTVKASPPPTLRIPFVRRCVIAAAERESDGMVLDLSLRGVYVASHVLPKVADRVTVRFRVPTNERTLVLSGIVAWVQEEQTHPVHGLPPGFGLRFRKMAVEDVRVIMQTIQAYCESNPIYRQYL